MKPLRIVQSTIKSTLLSFDSYTESIQHQIFYGSGGLSYLGLGLSASPLTTFHIGIRLNYIYGRTRQYQASNFENINFSSTTFDRSTYYSGFTFTLGTIYESIDKLLNLPSLHNLSIGLTLTTASSLDAQEQKIYAGSDTAFHRGTFDLPFSVGLGLSYLHHDRYRFLSDLVFENWGSTKYFGSHPTELRNSLRTSIGFESIPSREADTFWKRISYRTGFIYNSTYYKINDVGINELLISGGVGLPMGPESKFNVSLQVGMRGSTDKKLQKDTIIRLSVDISVSELWFLKFDEE